MSRARPILLAALNASLWASLWAPAVPARAGDHAPLIVGTWGGAYESVQRTVLFDPFTSRTGIPVQTVALSDPLATLQDASSATGGMMLADLPDADADAACAAHLTEPLDVSFYDRGNGAANSQSSDFIVPPTPCGIPSTVTGEVLVYATDAFGANTPARVTDIFDVAKFPGKRALKRDAMGTFEWALLADGVAPGEIYNVLATPDGIKRVFAKLDSIRTVTQWWDRGDVPLTWLARGDVTMAAAYSPWAYQAIVGEHLPLAIVWSGALTMANRWVIVKGQGEDPAAREFIKFATDTARLADFGRTTPYGAARSSAAQVITPEMADYSATTSEHLSSELPIDTQFWREHGNALRQRFETWLQATTASQPSADQAAGKE